MNTTLRVLLISPVGIHGGAEQVLLQLAKYLPQWNVEPSLACLHPGPLLDLAKQQGLPTYVFEKDYRYRHLFTVGQAIRWVTRLVGELKIDVLHSNYTAHLIGGPAAMLTRVPEVWHHHDYPYTRDLLSRAIEQIPTNHVVFTTNRVKSGYPRLCGGPHSVIHPICVEPERLRSYLPREGIRDQFHLPRGPLFVTVARLQRHKGHHHLIQAIPQVLQSYPEAVFALVGKASGPEQEMYRQELSDLAARLRVTESVKFLGYVNEQELIALYREATALVHPATSEGFGLALLEAMAIGTPVIAADADGPKEIIAHEQNGLLVPAADSSALSAAILRLLSTSSLRDTLRREGARFAERVKVENMVQQTVSVYEGLRRARYEQAPMSRTAG
jgi:glycosyltransferase involved in cell wall biosynthesis